MRDNSENVESPRWLIPLVFGVSFVSTKLIVDCYKPIVGMLSVAFGAVIVVAVLARIFRTSSK
jgi:hypothetical protein